MLESSNSSLTLIFEELIALSSSLQDGEIDTLQRKLEDFVRLLIEDKLAAGKEIVSSQNIKALVNWLSSDNEKVRKVSLLVLALLSNRERHQNIFEGYGVAPVNGKIMLTPAKWLFARSSSSSLSSLNDFKEKVYLTLEKAGNMKNRSKSMRGKEHLTLSIQSFEENDTKPFENGKGNPEEEESKQEWEKDEEELLWGSQFDQEDFDVWVLTKREAEERFKEEVGWEWVKDPKEGIVGCFIQIDNGKLEEKRKYIQSLLKGLMGF